MRFELRTRSGELVGVAETSTPLDLQQALQRGDVELHRAADAPVDETRSVEDLALEAAGAAKPGGRRKR